MRVRVRISLWYHVPPLRMEESSWTRLDMIESESVNENEIEIVNVSVMIPSIKEVSQFKEPTQGSTT